MIQPDSDEDDVNSASTNNNSNVLAESIDNDDDSLVFSTTHTSKKAKSKTGYNINLSVTCCCKNLCTSFFSELQRQQLREDYWGRSSEQQRLAWLITYISAQSPAVLLPYSHEPLIVLGRKVCKKAFCTLYGFSYGKFQAARNHLFFRNTTLTPMHGNSGHMANLNEGTLYAHAWFSSYIELMGDKMPNTNAIHLPHTLSWTDLWTKMVEDLRRYELPSVSFATFRALMKQHFSYVHKYRRHRLGRCDTCCKLDLQLHQAATDNARQHIVSLLRTHLQLIFQQRQAYYKKRLMAQAEPTQFMSIIIDYSDSLELPAVARLPKSWARKHRIPLQICGIINHGLRLGQLRVHWPVYGKGPNLILSHLFHHIQQVSI